MCVLPVLLSHPNHHRSSNCTALITPTPPSTPTPHTLQLIATLVTTPTTSSLAGGGRGLIDTNYYQKPKYLRMLNNRSARGSGHGGSSCSGGGRRSVGGPPSPAGEWQHCRCQDRTDGANRRLGGSQVALQLHWSAASNARGVQRDPDQARHRCRPSSDAHDHHCRWDAPSCVWRDTK